MTNIPSPTSQRAKRVLLMENISQKAVEVFKQAGCEVTEYAKLTQEELLMKIESFDVIGVRSKTKLTKKVLNAASRLVAVGCFCIGTDQTDLSFAAASGIPVFNAPFANTRSVAEVVISCIIGLARGVGDSNIQMHQGIWKKVSKERYEVRGKTLGIVGYGHVGSQLSILAEALGMSVIYYDLERKLPLGNATAVGTFDELLATADFVSLHVPMTEETNTMITTETIAKMKKRSYLINFARGKVCDTDAVAKALRDGHLAGAAFDVYPSEPGHGEGFENALKGCPNTILTPHIGGSTEEAQTAIGIEVSTKLVNFIKSGTTMGAVNFPEVSLRKDDTKHRIMNVHHNVPGVLRDINNVLGDYNVSAQVLGTEDKIGYLLCHIDNSVSAEICRKIAELPHSIRTRIVS